MLDIDAFISEAEAYCEVANIKLATLGAYAVGDKTMFSRLAEGRNVGVRQLQRVVAYMAANPRPERGASKPEKDVS